MESKFLFIGTGVMSEGIIKEVIREEKIKAKDIFIYNRTKPRMEYLKQVYGVNPCYHVNEGIDSADNIIIGVKPQDMNDVLEDIKKSKKTQLVVSIAAGKSISHIEEKLGSERKIIRVMPNSMVDVKKGYSAICCNANVTKEEMEFWDSIFKSIGDTIWIKEQLFDAFTGFSCSGPGLIYEFIEAMVDAGVYNGFNRRDSLDFTIKNLIGACEMIKTTKEHPVILKENMTSPGGITITGLKALNEAGFKGIVQNAVTKAVNKSKEL
ncbi:MAG: pyrroline-5-carboxylate reductase [Solirubrobacterales bacterium]